MKFKIVPDCSEGFKRLAIVVGIIAAITLLAYFLAEWNGNSEMWIGMGYNRLLYWLPLFLIYVPGLFYVVVLIIRTIGWIFAGFSKKEDEK